MDFYTKNDIIYQKIKDKIIYGIVKPGERLVISELADEFNVSSMPVREAIKRLQQDHFVEVIPHIGARVISFELERFRETVLIMIELEGLAAKLVIPYIDESRIIKLDQMLEAMEVTIKEKDNSMYGQLNKEFHMLIYSAGPYSQLYELIMNYWEKTEFLKAIFTKFIDRPQKSYEEHILWLNAIKEGDTEKSKEILKMHRESAFEIFIESHIKEAQSKKFSY
ncbi:GntR family transcriptional regulator [Geosporobacter ferrireducens]|uniref:HTH gntR-type domain-containing protein n=1 Tax=Geosporobacter ferrireducens TaxID=1424294 RepID=A0A1D8GF63_9FIRM|nr:GntR family transcriptional regulator [Geosporobacter ferrireducens]AOT69534.1 hypothetical protein Gferi_08070 [Geosporobacter ferrireducens]MTI54772.1 GntR family transcriptional regulator [Geosporobacter ferrireducens]